MYNRDEVIWTSRDGRKLTLNSITDSHLVNLVNWMQNSYKTIAAVRAQRAASMSMFFGDEVSPFLDEIQDIWLEIEDPGEIFTQYDDLLEEIERRGLR